MEDLRELRRRRGLTVEAMGVLAGVDAATVSRVERGQVDPQPETIVKLARGLGVSAKRMREIVLEAKRRSAADEPNEPEAVAG